MSFHTTTFWTTPPNLANDNHPLSTTPHHTYVDRCGVDVVKVVSTLPHHEVWRGVEVWTREGLQTGSRA
jgi:hypothetical protein